ncbi:S1 family peptidase [Lignipirellula cremea]|uniref:Periplasmic serine endoprotease DegP n=1 Tax=Lignipirellula cremea TaxID=2528010 RepID=A0A518DYC1_9BACT|nr:serine protease [Lignipirellula cremea]QDU96785.1 Periplasmic serine endoprotease DegP precursor [Lignipirellula cremea]
MKTSHNLLRREIVTAAVLLCGGLLTSTASAQPAVYQQALKATTWVLAKNSEGTSSGTGVLIDKERKLVITNAHVVGDSRNTVIFFPAMVNNRPKVERSYYLENVRKLGIRGRVIAVDRKRDLALVELSSLPEGAEAVKMATESVPQAATVHSIGNPGSSEALWVYTSGTVRTVYQKKFRTGAGQHDFMVVETQAPINSGDSGGPVVDDEGNLVAISQAIAPKARLISYCVDITEVKTFLESPWKPAPLPVTELLKTMDREFSQHSSGHYEVSFELANEEKVSVFITKDIEYYERADVRKIWTLTNVSKKAPSAETALKLLQLSARTKIGAWTMEQTQTGEYLIIYCVKLDATASADAVSSTMEYVAKLSAAMKKDLAEKPETASAGDTLANWLAD